MQALRKLRPESDQLELADVPTPEPRAGEVRIAVTGAGICGTDLHILHGDYASRPPVTLGHEIAGRVDALGSGTDGGFARHVLVPARNLHRLPDDLDDHAAALCEPLACVCNALLDPDVIQPGDRVVVFGAGAVGLLAAQVARASGGSVLLLGARGDDARLEIGSALGFDVASVEDPEVRARLDQESAARSVDVVVEAAGAASAVASGLRLIRPGGHYVQMGLLSGNVSVPFGEIVTREIAVRAGFGSSPASWLRLERLLAGRHVELLPLVSAVLPLDRYAEAMKRFDERVGLKTIFDPRLS